jgi:(E)-4-hydroxy-3-methylbut-2-enyl-diphosphate synthase
MNPRASTRSVAIGGLSLGGNEHIVIQSMCNIKTSRYEEVADQINRCASLGAELMRVSVLDFEDAAAIKEIKKRTSVPLVADIHIDYRLALASLDSGVDAVRINPGNIGSNEKVKAVVDACKAHHAPIRIGVNSGSLDKSIYFGKDVIKGEYLLESAAKHVKILEDMDFHDIVLSLKGSSVAETLEAYRLAAKRFPYPLHLGITEAGPKDIGLIRSAAGLSPLLLEGIGNTIRISLSDAPEEEVKACCRLLHDLDLKPDYPTFISCPTCGRTQVNLIPLAQKVLNYVESHHINKTIAVMGCIVNGPGEARHADLGIAGGKGEWVIFKKGEVVRTVKDEEAYAALVEEINKL